jgi:hypothetical protein
VATAQYDFFAVLAVVAPDGVQNGFYPIDIYGYGFRPPIQLTLLDGRRDTPITLLYNPSTPPSPWGTGQRIRAAVDYGGTADIDPGMGLLTVTLDDYNLTDSIDFEIVLPPPP